jgi:general stress protein 26
MKTRSFADIQDTFFEYVSDIRYSTMITVDSKGRPRARVLLPIWEAVDERLVGWLAAYKTPVKVAHLAGNPHTTFSYWSPKQNAVFVDSVADWVDDPDVKRRVWDLYRRASSPRGVGYDPLNFWRAGPSDPQYHVLRVEPWRVQLVRGSDLSSTIWHAD